MQKFRKRNCKICSKPAMQKEWWEKDWDDVFNEMLSGAAIDLGDRKLTFNGYAKQKIKEIISKELEDYRKKHNLLVLTKECIDPLKRDLEFQPKRLLKELESIKGRAEEKINKLKQIYGYINR